MLKRFAVRAAAAAVVLASLIAGLVASACYAVFAFLQWMLAEAADVGGWEAEDSESEFSLLVMLGLFVAPALIVAALTAGVIVLRRSRRALLGRRGRKLDAAARARAWRELHARCDALMVRWSRYETDVALMIDYPIMTDYSDPVIREVLKAMQAIRSAEADGDHGDPARSPLRKAVDRFEVAFLAAERHARRLGQTRLSAQERGRLSAARAALNIILDPGAPPSEVEAAYRSLRSSLRGILDLPPQVTASLEARARPARPLDPARPLSAAEPGA